MRVKKIDLKRIVSYLLIFSLFFTTAQIGNIKKASADATNQVPGLTLYVGDKTDNKTRIIDKNSGGQYTCEYLPIGTSFYLEAQTGYIITGVTSSSSNMAILQVGNSTGGSDWKITSISDYSNFTLTVTMKDNSTGITTVYPIIMSFESDSSLEFGTLKVTFDNQTSFNFDYNQTDANGNYLLPNIDSSIKTATIQMIDKNNTPMTFTVNGGSSNTVNLVGGENDIIITRTYLNTSKQYKLIITKKGQAKLQSLVPSTGTLSPAFNSDTYDYAITVPTTQSTIAFTPTTVDNASTVKVNGATVRSGNKSPNIQLDEGENDIDIEVKTTDGDTSTYTVAVTRTAQFRSANLTGLTLTSGTLSPTFNKGIYEYTATVENSVTSIGVTPIAEDANSTITVNSKKIPSGATSPYISLDEGVNVINVVVTDTKGNSNTYVLTITRKYSKDNVNLASLSVTDGTMSPKFDPETYVYSVKEARNVEKVKVLYTSQNDKAKIKINGKEYTNGQSDYIKLDIGANLITVEVTAEDGKTTTTYKLSVIRGDIEGTNQWVLVAGNWTFYDATGIQVKNQWVKYDNQWYFLDINGYMQTGWINESGNWYYLNQNGIMQTGWIYDKGYWYYLQGDGSMRTNVWATYDGKWYFFNQYGQMITGWTLYNGRWYFMDDHGVMQKGWITYDKNKYYINDDGTMRNGWLYSGKVWYYLDDAGKMVRGWQNINGKNYYFDASGAMKTGMMFLDGQWINLNNA
ncbi:MULTISPECIES: cadherin-like beta sandwich domain-containing protein [unclassified Clostridium]|uniref:cadherin-like beta sandwich domain-containing protein n=1 Tax=unclassified Clostridium TaxID=2614128 RepID=UPI0002981200|nr:MULTISPECIES: cadherin-like beta sandwich domain-containing protein [unclassified Clostridium]EKQ50511.1 MAG: putative cell wall binding protein [Clostridium sp. Maddingley MBC34-26]